jgi:hypothetical protein
MASQSVEGVPPEMASPVCRWGIMGCASIARKNARCMLLAENASVVAVVSSAERGSVCPVHIAAMMAACFRSLHVDGVYAEAAVHLP